MSGYGVYIWSAYGAAALVLVGLWLTSVRALKAREAELARAEAASPRARR
jgi:heme exporter protein CcmD